MTEKVFGTLENLVFSSDDGSFVVAKLKEPKKKELTLVVGPLGGLSPGESLQCVGSWSHHPKYGRQFTIESFTAKAPSTIEGIQKYLESGMIKGIGPAYAERIVQKFGSATLDIIDKDPGALLRVEGIGEKRVKKIIACWEDQREIRQVMVFLRSYNVSTSFAQKIFRRYGKQSIEKMRENPYRIAQEIRGIGFKSADLIASQLGIEKMAPVRLDAGLEHTLWELSNEGHTCAFKEYLLVKAEEMLEIEKSALEARLDVLATEGRIHFEEGKIWIRPLYLAEKGIAVQVERLLKSPATLRKVKEDKAVEWVEKALSLTFAPLQTEAIKAALSEKMLLITGGPGTGKSTITKAILAITGKLTNEITLAAPTGRAAKRLSEITGHKAQTIHSLLEMDFSKGGFKRNRDHPLSGSLFIIDEASMIDTALMHALLKAIPSTARLILVGDIDQLPSVGPGNILRDMIESGAIKTSRLEEIFRQGKGSDIVANAHLINRGEFPHLFCGKGSDFRYIEAEEPEKIVEEILSLVSTRLPKAFRFHKFDDIQILSPMKKGLIGTENLNQVLQNTLNPSHHPTIRMGRRFHVGDKVMQLRNNYQKEVYNGDIGYIQSLDESEQTLTVRFDLRRVSYDFSELDEITLAYAVSIHKYQGSECPCVIIPVHTSHFKLLYRNLLYTGLTRGKKLVILIGTKKAIGIAINAQEVQKRTTGLISFLKSL